MPPHLFFALVFSLLSSRRIKYSRLGKERDHGIMFILRKGSAS
jgi:hypothetical protein